MGKLFNSTDIDIKIEQDDFNELKNRVYRQFGYPKVSIEISDDDFSYIIKDGLMYLSTWTPKIEYVKLNVKAHQSDYELSEIENINSILDVFVSSGYLIGLGLPIQSLMGTPMSLSATNNPAVIQDYMSLMSAYNTAKNIFQVEPLPELIGANKIRILPTPYMDDEWIIQLTLNHESNLGSLSKWEREWLIRYCKMGVGKFIGQVRRKYDGVSLPVGSLSGSGGAIYSESLEEEKTLMEELKNYKKFAQSYIAIG